MDLRRNRVKDPKGAALMNKPFSETAPNKASASSNKNFHVKITDFKAARECFYELDRALAECRVDAQVAAEKKLY
jgi:hypothetical protein